MGEILLFHFRVTSAKLINEKNPINMTVWMFVNPEKSIPFLIFLRTSYNIIPLGFPGMLNSRSDMDVVSNRWRSIRYFFRGCISLGSRDIQVQSFDHVTSYSLNDRCVVKYYPLKLPVLINYLEFLQILKKCNPSLKWPSK